MYKHPKNIFGRRLRTARERVGIPQDKLGVMIGLDESCSSARISRYETGTHAPPFETAQKIAAALNIPTSYLYCEDDQLAELILAIDPMSASEKDELMAHLNGIK